MCAIDALGVASMVGKDTLIESVDVTTDEEVTIVMAEEEATWKPPTAVVFVGAETCGGPSADCCCEYLNFFANESAAEAWSRDHPHVLGEIPTQTEALALSIRLFQPLRRLNQGNGRTGRNLRPS